MLYVVVCCFVLGAGCVLCVGCCLLFDVCCRLLLNDPLSLFIVYCFLLVGLWALVFGSWLFVSCIVF